MTDGPVKADAPSKNTPFVDPKTGKLTDYGHRWTLAHNWRTGGPEDRVWQALGLGFTGLARAGMLESRIGDVEAQGKALDASLAGLRGDPRLAAVDRIGDEARNALATALSRAPAEALRRLDEIESAMKGLFAVVQSLQAQSVRQQELAEAERAESIKARTYETQSIAARNKQLQDEVDGLESGFNARVRDAITATAPIVFNATTGDISWTGDTDDVPEGANLYFTNARARAALSGTGAVSYNATTGVINVPTRTGWAAPTGTATRTTFATTTVTTEQLAERVKALIDDLTTSNILGA